MVIPRGGRTVEKAAWAFYAIAAAGSTIGQTWVGVVVPPWPDTMPWWLRAALVLPFAMVIDLGGIVTSAFADYRQRLGERALGWRVLSAVSVSIAVGINVIGHIDEPYLSVVFGGLGTFAYSVWLMHAASRRRDALRAAGKLEHTAPVYSLAQWRREPAVTARARSLALERGYSLHKSLAMARRELREEKRRAALASHIERLIKSRHNDPIMADIAVTTLDLDAVAAELSAQADVEGWARTIGAELRPPAPEPQQAAALEQFRVPTNAEALNRWRAIWVDMTAHPRTSTKRIAERHGVSVRTAQMVRSAGRAGLLDPPLEVTAANGN